jgi:arabinofuranosyltransferase
VSITTHTTKRHFVLRNALILSLIIASFLILIRLFWQFTTDDAYITFRYADNLACGLGPVYNPGERVEGYTSFSWMLLMAVVRTFQGDPVVVAKVIGILCSLLTLAIIYKLAWFVSQRPKTVAWITVLGLATSSALALNTVMGLETPLYTLLLVLAVYCLFRETKSRRWWLSTTLFALAALTRPEGLAVFGLTWLYQVLVAKGKWRRALIRLAIFGVIVGGHFIWRWSYYGELLPATYYAKTGDTLPRLQAGLLYLVEFLIGPGLFLVTAYLLALWQREKRMSYLLWLCGGYIALIVWEGGDWMPGLRFWAPILPFLYLILAKVLVNSYYRFRALATTHQKVLGGVGLGVLGGLYVLLLIGYTVITWLYSSMRVQGYEQAHRSLATWLHDNTSPDASVALMDIGIIGYYSQRRIIDLTGLTESHIAHTPGAFQDKIYDPAYVLDQAPEYVILVSTDGDLVPDFPIDRRIYQSPLFQAHYEYTFKLAHMGDGDGAGYYLLVFERKQTLPPSTRALSTRAFSQRVAVGLSVAKTLGICAQPHYGPLSKTSMPSLP